MILGALRTLILLIALLTAGAGQASYQIYYGEPPVLDSEYCADLLTASEIFYFKNRLTGDPLMTSIFDLVEASGRREWLPSEQNQISQTVDRLYTAFALKDFFRRIRRVGNRSFYRLGQDASTAHMMPRPRVPGGYMPFIMGIILYDEYFNTESSQITDTALLHELAHAFDGFGAHEYSLNAKFLSLTGWRLVKSASRHQWIYRDINPQTVQHALALVTRMSRDGHRAEAQELNRVIAHEWGLPSIYAATSPWECFAELVAYIALEPEHAEYVRPEIISWFRRYVLH